MNINMAGYFPHVMVALLMIYLRTTNAIILPSFNFDKISIEEHLCEERAPFLQRFFSGGFSKAEKFHETNSCTGLDDDDLQSICDRVAERLIIHDNNDKFESFSEVASDLEIPILADGIRQIFPFSRKWIQIENLDMDKGMYWCGPRRYIVSPDTESDPEQEAWSDWEPEWTDEPPRTGQIYGFWFAGSTSNEHRVYVFRSRTMDAQEVIPIAEAELIEGYSSSSLSSDSE